MDQMNFWYWSKGEELTIPDTDDCAYTRGEIAENGRPRRGIDPGAAWGIIAYGAT